MGCPQVRGRLFLLAKLDGVVAMTLLGQRLPLARLWVTHSIVQLARVD